MTIGPPTGMRDWLPLDTLRRQHLMETIGSVYRLYGYLPIDTPAMEDLPVLLGKGGGENEKLLFKILKRGEKLERALETGDVADYGLRFDLTVPLARFVATHQGKLPKVFRCYHIAPVWRADRPQRGRFREFYQCDIDVVNGASPAYEVEIITAMERVLKELDLGTYWFRISDKHLLPLLLEGFGVPAEKITAILTLLDKREKIPLLQFESELGDILERDSVAWRKVWSLLHVPEINVDHNILLGKGTGYEHYEKIFDGVEEGAIREKIDAIRENLDEIIKSVREINKNSRLIFHPTLVRGMDYYTGPVYEAVMDKGPKTAILGGGRYDDLIGMFAGKKIPAVGCSIGFERVLAIQQERASGQVSTLAPRVLLLRDEDNDVHLHAQAEFLRNEGLPIETYLDPDNVGKQLKYAEAAGILWAIKRFDREGSSLTIRYLPTRQDRTVSLAEFKSLLAAP
ncbi:MAG TPA: histidine--tRNA ligase [Nitrospirales bacterium]|nr:histidine--tRNA ligase [Nitrospirales bacterium]